jgi:putative ABC transport system permease protein
LAANQFLWDDAIVTKCGRLPNLPYGGCYPKERASNHAMVAVKSYALTILWHERSRFLAGVLAVAFSALLIAVQCGLLLGMFTFASLPIDHAPAAHIWLGGPNIRSVDLGRPMPASYVARLAGQPEVAQAEAYLQAFTYWVRPDGGFELCMVVGSRLEDEALGAVRELTAEMRARLSEPGTVVVDESERERLGVQGIGDNAQIGDRRVRVVGFVHGFRGIAGSYVFCSIETARSLLHLAPEQTIYLLGRCHTPQEASTVVKRLRSLYPKLSIFTREEFSLRSRVHWLTKTKAGIALGYAAALGLLVGAVVTSQTLYAATASSLREYAVLWALGIPLWRMASLVLAQSFWVGVLGVVLALPAIFALGNGADVLGVTVLLPLWLLAGTVTVTLGMALFSGLAALRLLWRMEPAILLR